jgi:hypothetical protein
MPLPDAASLKDLSPAELRDLVGMLVTELRALQVGAEAQQATMVALHLPRLL